MSDLERAKERLEELADLEETERLAKEAENADYEYDVAYATALLEASAQKRLTNPTMLKAWATTDPQVRELGRKAKEAKAIWNARLEAGRNARAVLDGERSINADRRAIV